MREILFRGKIITDDQWVYGGIAIAQDETVIILTKEEQIVWNVIPGTVGQFTGLTDKNGVKIFEGDIITVNSKIVKQVRINDAFLAVQVANKEDLKFIDLLDPWQTPGEVWWNDFGSEIIVVGNIHDNPELLK